MSLKESSSLTGRISSFGVKGCHVLVGHLSGMLYSAGKEQVDGASNMERGNRDRPSDEMGDRLKKSKRSSALLYG